MFRSNAVLSFRIFILNTLRFFWRLLGYRGLGIIRPLEDRIAPVTPIVARVNCQLMLLNLHETYNINLFNNGTRYVEEYQPFCDSIKTGMTVVDVGANIGLFTLAAAHLVGSEGHVIAFEPLQRNYYFLITNVTMNGYTNVWMEQMAVSNTEGYLDLYCFGTDNLSLSDKVIQGWGSGKSEAVPCCRLDHYLETRGISKVDVVKIDVEGAEKYVLEGMRNILSVPEPPRMIVEIHPDFLESLGCSAREVLELLSSYDYMLYYLDYSGKHRIQDISTFEIPYQPSRRPLNRFRIYCDRP